MFNQDFTIEIYICTACVNVTLKITATLLPLQRIARKRTGDSWNQNEQASSQCLLQSETQIFLPFSAKLTITVAKEGRWNIHHFYGTASQDVRENGPNDPS